MGWGDTPDVDTVFDRFKANGWLKKLYILTYNYLMYGMIDGAFKPTSADVVARFDTLTSADITFVTMDDSTTTTTNGDYMSLENTTCCFKNAVFETYV